MEHSSDIVHANSVPPSGFETMRDPGAQMFSRRVMKVMRGAAYGSVFFGVVVCVMPPLAHAQTQAQTKPSLPDQASGPTSDTASPSDVSSSADARFREIAAERDALQARRLSEEKICYQRFAVNGCLINVRDRFAPLNAELRQRELNVRNSERARKENERQARMALAREKDERNKEAAAQRAASAVPAQQREADASQKQAARAAALPDQRARAQGDKARAELSVTQAQQQQARKAAEAPENRARFEQKQRDAADRVAAEQRKAREAAAKPNPPKPLPRQPESELPRSAPLPAPPPR